MTPREEWRREERDYDYEAYIEKYGVPDQSKGQHLTDEFKLPNHITFSTGSKYSTPEKQGGEWRKDEDGKWHFFASPYNLQNYSKEALMKYFEEKEPDSFLHLPTPYLSLQREAPRLVENSSPIREKYKRLLGL